MTDEAADPYQAMAEEDEQRRIQDHLEAAKLFDPEVVLASINTIHTINDEKLGAIRYGKLSKKEFDSVKDQTPDARVSKRIYLMLKKAYPQLTEEQYEQWPAEVVMRITDILAGEQTRFLQRTPQTSPAGSKTTPKP